MGSLGTASLTLTANSQGLDKGLAKGEKDIKGWGSRVGGLIGKGIGAFAKGGAAGVGFAAAGMGLEQLSAPLDRLKDISKMGDIASAFGLTPEKFSGIAGLAKASGSDLRDFTEGLATLSGKASEAAAGKGEEAQAIFQQLGVDAAKFSQLKPDEQFYALFEALNKVQDPAQRVNLLLKAVGEDTGKNMLSLLGKSTEELQRQASAFSMSSESVAAAQMANEKYQTAMAKMESATNKIVVAIAPLVEVLADGLTAAIDWVSQQFTAAEGVFNSVGQTMFEWAGIAGGAWQGFLDIIKPVTDWISEQLTQAWNWCSEQIANAIQWIEENIGSIPKTTEDAMKLVAEGVGIAVGSFVAAEGVIKLFVGNIISIFGKLVQAIGKVIDFAQAMQEALPQEMRLDLSGASAAVKNFGKVSEMVGDTLQKAGTDKLLESVTAAEAAKQKFLGFLQQGQKDGLNAWDQWAADRHKRIDDKVNKWKAGGNGEIKMAVDVKLLKGVEATLQGSKQWQEAIARSYMQDRFGTQNKQLAAQQHANALLGKIANALSKPLVNIGIW